MPESMSPALASPDIVRLRKDPAALLFEPTLDFCLCSARRFLLVGERERWLLYLFVTLRPAPFELLLMTFCDADCGLELLVLMEPLTLSPDIGPILRVSRVGRLETLLVRVLFLGPVSRNRDSVPKLVGTYSGLFGASYFSSPFAVVMGSVVLPCV
jgi:hypothetical protein